MNRKNFIIAGGLAAAGSALAGSSRKPKAERFNISLAQWSVRELHLGVKGTSPEFKQKMRVAMKDASIYTGPVDPLDFAGFATKECGIKGLEYVNMFYYTHAGDDAYFDQLKKRADDAGAESLLIMCDGCGMVGAPNAAKRQATLELHKPWIHAAAQLGCHSIRVNAKSMGTFEEQQKLATEGLRLLGDYAKSFDINIIVENHGGLSSNGQWLAGVMKQVDLPNIGTLPDFGNFCLNKKTDEWYDRYQGVAELMPYAKGVSAKSHAFDAAGNETKTDFFKMMKIVADSGYTGYVGVEYEGTEPPAKEGILATKALLERTFKII
jgi:L-ribulose-5-phosphate 3-epimerase